MFVGLQLYSEKLNELHPLHIDGTILADENYELVPENGGISGAQVNQSGIFEAQVNQAGISEELNQSEIADLTNISQEGKPQSITYIFTCYAIHIYVYISVLVCAFKL